ncbi:hypothetical protein AVEN_163913-1 [Araneus ventricosus]|uniref:Uncharacterized protein n=1 Tax=Araneus ventricosus TaxID=182803 RepID=A0A4Y2PHA2_ARAVE|nr:hypothetical protein AVEN_163913-1 [Araneus ventricosus]
MEDRNAERTRTQVLDSWPMYSVTSLLRYNPSNSSSACFSFLNSSKTAEYCSVRIISHSFVIASLGYGDRFMHFEARLDEIDGFIVSKSVEASRMDVNRRLEGCDLSTVDSFYSAYRTYPLALSIRHTCQQWVNQAGCGTG